MAPYDNYTLRLVRDNDQEIDVITRFYEENRHEGNRVRDPLEMIRSISEKKFFFINDNAGSIVAAGGCFSSGVHREVGATRVIKNGFGFQRILHYIRTVSEFFWDPPAGKYFTVIASWNKASITNTIRCFFSEFTPDKCFMTQIHKDNSQNVTKRFFYLSPDMVRKHAELIIRLDNQPVISNKNTGENVQLYIDVPLIRHSNLRSIVEGIASGQVDIPEV